MNPHRNRLSDESIEDTMTIENQMLLEKVKYSRKNEEIIFDDVFVEIDDEENEEFESIIAEEEAKLIDDA
uniref:Uncharacterized protein n=1 Tax=Panagrolaimus davidi TaxID=227884 RepID=A0A914PQW3_9BILA